MKDPPAVAPAEAQAGAEHECRVMRDRYVAARFQGVVRAAADLRSQQRARHLAQVFLEEGRTYLAAELLDVALEENPGDKGLRLAQLELAFLSRDTSRFATLAAALRTDHPHCPEWPQVEKLGRCLHSHRDALPGSWPDTPNWLEGSLDLAAEVMASELHNAIARLASGGRIALARLEDPACKG